MADTKTETKQTDVAQSLSVQKRSEKSADTTSSVLWFSRDYDGSDISPWWSPNRDLDLDLFWRRRGNDILQGAISSMVKKFKSMNWNLTGPEKTIARYQKVLNEAEFGKGWEILLGKSLQQYLTQDKGGFWELIGTGNPNGPIEGPVLGMAALDSQFCQLTGDINFPVVYYNSKTDRAHKLHASRVVHLVDMPSPNELMNDIGYCAVSRVIASSSVLLKLAKYKDEKLDDLPEAGLLIFNNILPQQWDDARADYARERRRLGQELWTNVMSFFSLDPAAQASAELISFSSLPDAFNESEATELYVNIVALAFGVDVREFWPMSAGPLGTGAETTVQAQKAKGKGIGDIISTIERAINWKILPPSIEFEFDAQDDEEDELRAKIEDLKVSSIVKMAGVKDSDGSNVIQANEIRQMLADNISYFQEDFLAFDSTEETTLQDNEKSYGPIRTIDRYGKLKPLSKRHKVKQYVNQAIEYAADNYRQGKVSAEDVAEFALSQLVEK
jgi:hypothetical protein